MRDIERGELPAQPDDRARVALQREVSEAMAWWDSRHVAPTTSPFTRRALQRELPTKELTR